MTCFHQGWASHLQHSKCANTLDTQLLYFNGNRVKKVMHHSREFHRRWTFKFQASVSQLSREMGSPWCFLIVSGPDFHCGRQTLEHHWLHCLPCVLANPRSPWANSAQRQALLWTRDRCFIWRRFSSDAAGFKNISNVHWSTCSYSKKKQQKTQNWVFQMYLVPQAVSKQHLSWLPFLWVSLILCIYMDIWVAIFGNILMQTDQQVTRGKKI